MLIKNAQLWYVKMDPKKPNAMFDKENPTWEIQMRTDSKKEAAEWKAANLKVKAEIPEEGKPYWKCNVKRKSFKSNGDPIEAPKLVNGKLSDIDPNTVGNGSIGDVQIFQYEYDMIGKEGKRVKGIASMLKGVMLKKHIVYVPQPHEDDFELSDTEVVQPPSEEEAEDPSTEVEETF
jgi:hypothetical protein